MGTVEPTVEELEAGLEEEKDNAQQQIINAGEEAAREAKAAGLSEEEVKKRVEKARKEEKDKLYAKISALETSLTEVQEILRQEKAEKDDIKRKAEEEQENQRKSALSTEDRTIESLNKLEEQLKREREERKESERKAAEKAREWELKEYRTRAIQAVHDAGEDLIPELVVGNNEAEIDEAIERAKARYTEFAEKFKTEKGERAKRSMPRSTSPSLEALEEQELDEQLTSYDADKYLKDPEYRAAIQRKLAEAYGGQGR